MKKSLIFVIIILLISLVAFPVIFAEGGTSYLIDTKNVDTEVLSNMDNYMKLNSPVAIDKTADYLAVANNSEIFIQPQNNKKNAYYKTIDKDIEKLIVLGDKIIALTTSENITNLVVIDAVDKTEKPYTSAEYQNIISITKKNNQLAILKKSDEFLLFDITDGNNLVQSGTTTTLALGAIIGQNFKIINNFGYLMTNTGTIKQYNFNTNTLADFATLPNSIKDFYVSNDTIYYIDTNHKLFIGDKTIEIEDTKFNQLAFNGDKIYATANNNGATDNGKVYVFDKNGNKLDKITSKGDDIFRFDTPQGVFSDGTYLFIADTNNKRIIKRNVENDIRTPIQVAKYPTKVVTIKEQIYYIDKESNLYYGAGSNPVIEEKVQSIAAYNDKLLILTENNIVLSYNGNKATELISNIQISANEMTSAVNTNFVYLINKNTGDIAKYNLEKPDEPVFKDRVNIGNNYNIDFRGNLYVENNGKISKYKQDSQSNSTKFTLEGEYNIQYKSSTLANNSNIVTAVDSINAEYYFANVSDHLLFKINGSDIGLVGTKNINYNAPTNFDLLDAGKIKDTENEILAYIAPNNPESARIVQKDEIFLILASSTTSDGKTFYYVMSKHLAQKEYIEQDAIEHFSSVNMQNQKMTAIVDNVSVYTYPHKFADKFMYNDKEFKLSKTTEVECVEQIAQDGIYDWYKITFTLGGKKETGYVFANYISKVVPITPPKNIIFMKTKAPKIGTNIKIYQDADANSKVLFDDVKDGIDIQIVGEFDAKSTFTKVYYNEQIGYILTENLQPNGLTPNQIIAITITSVAIVAFAIIALLFVHKNKNSKKKIEDIEPDILG